MACESCRAYKLAIAERDVVIAALLASASTPRRPAEAPVAAPACVFCGARVAAEAVQVWLAAEDYAHLPIATGYHHTCRRCHSYWSAMAADELEAARYDRREA